MQRRRQMMAIQKNDDLPSEYQRVEWVNGVGCNIDLNYVPTVEPRVVSSLAITSTNDKDLMGFPSNTYPSFIVDVYIRGSDLATSWYNRYGATSRYSFDFQFDYNPAAQAQIHPNLFEFGSTVRVDGTTYATISGVDWSSNTQSFHLFGARTNYNGARIYTFELWDGNNLVRDLIPCYRKSDNVIGFYDRITKSLFTSTVGTLSIPS